MKDLTKLFLLIGLISFNLKAQEKKTFANVNEVFSLVKKNNFTFQNAKLQTELADITRKTAYGNIFNPKIPSSIQAIDNINQQVSFLPGQVFGMPAGTYKEVIIGQQYATTFNIQPQFDILNLANIAQIKSSKINQQLTENQNKINEQNIYNQINAVYFNILSFQSQKEIIIKNIAIANQIKQIITNKFNEGIARKQDVNEAEVNLVSLQDKLEQIEINIKMQYQTLDLFFENKLNSNLTQSIDSYDNNIEILETKNNLQSENAKLQRQLAQQEYKSIQLQNVPVLSFVSSFNWQNLSNDKFFSSNSNWINYSFVGLKLSYDFPTTVQKLSNYKSKQIQLESLKINEEHSLKETENKNNLMILEYEKSVKQKLNFKKIYELKKDTYEKNFNQFKENILPLDKLLISQNDMLISELNVVSALANIGFNKTKIEINNNLK